MLKSVCITAYSVWSIMTVHRPHTLLFQHSPATDRDHVYPAHTKQVIYMTRDPFTLLRGRGETTTRRKKDQTKGKAFTVMLGEESALMQASAVLKLRDFSICVCRITSHTPRAFVQASLLSSLHSMVFISGQKKGTKNWTKIPSLLKMEQICPTPCLFFRKAFLYLNSIQRHVRSTVWTPAILGILSRCIKLIEKRVNGIIWLWLYISLSRQSSSQIQQSDSHLHSRPSRSLLWWQHEISDYKVRDALQTRGIQTPMQHISTPWTRERALYFHAIIQMWSALKLSWSLVQIGLEGLTDAIQKNYSL